MREVAHQPAQRLQQLHRQLPSQVAASATRSSSSSSSNIARSRHHQKLRQHTQVCEAVHAFPF